MKTKEALHLMVSNAKEALIPILVTLFFAMLCFSCKKEFSCEGCRVTDDQTPATNHPPVANAGADQTINLPATTATLDGKGSTDPDNNITGYLWKKISGPSPSDIATANQSLTEVNNLAEGAYEFELTVTDADGLSDKDTVLITVVRRHVGCTDCKIVFVSDRDGNPEIYSCNADGSDIQRLTNSPLDDEDPAWSPDGTRIAFMSARTGIPEIYIMNADGSNVIRRTFTESYSGHPTWSPDGTKIAYSAITNSTTNIWVVGATTGSPSMLFDGDTQDDHPAWSPDGTKIAFASNLAGTDHFYDIYTIAPDGTGLGKIPVVKTLGELNYLAPSWSPDGSRLAMEIRQPSGVDAQDTRIGTMNADGTGLRPIAAGIKAGTATTWSADGTRVAYTSLSGSRKDVAWAFADGSSRGTIVTNGWNPNWQH